MYSHCIFKQYLFWIPFTLTLLNNVYLFYFILFLLTLLFILNGDISALSLLPARSGSGEAGPPDSWLLVPSLLRVVMAMGAPAPACVVVVPIATGHRPPQRPLAFGAVPPHLALCPSGLALIRNP